MSQPDPRDELLAAGLEGYPGAICAIAEFSKLIKEATRFALTVHIERLKVITANGKLSQTDIKDIEAKQSSWIEVGCFLPLPQTWGVYCGVRWNTSEPSSLPKAFISVRFGSKKIRDNLFNRLYTDLKDDPNSVQLLCPKDYPYDVLFTEDLLKGNKTAQLQEALTKVVSVFLGVCEKNQTFLSLVPE